MATATARQLADDFFHDDKWADPVEQLIFADYLDDRCGRPLDAALRRVLVEPSEDRHRLDYAEALERQAVRVKCPECDGDGYRMAEVQVHVEREDCPHCRGSGTAPDGRAERAEFVRMQVELARKWNQEPPCGEDLRPLRRRERELLDLDHSRVDGELPNYVRWFDLGEARSPSGETYHGPSYTLHSFFLPEFRRGFVACLTCTTADFLAHAGAVFGAAPVERVRLSDRRPLWGSVVGPYQHHWFDPATPRHFGSVESRLPLQIWNQLERPLTGDWSVAYPTEADALADLSAACVAFGRAAARLPPLPAP